MKRSILFLIFLAISSGSLLASEQTTADSEKLGKVHLPVSCTPAAQQQFDRAVSILHSFGYPQGLQAFAEVTNTDPSCAMAYWGMAMSRRSEPAPLAHHLIVRPSELSAQKMSLDYPLCASQAAFSIVT